MATMIPKEALEVLDESRIDRAEAIILSMTPSERQNPDVLDISRINWIAGGSGTSRCEISDRLGQFHAMRKTLRSER